MGAAIFSLRAAKRDPKLRRTGRSEMELRRKHTDDEIGVAAQRDRPSQNVGSPIEAPLPSAIADQDGTRSAG
jgi:hypothetical protein